MKVSKFGGSSLATADEIKRVIAIVQSDPERQYIVVSAPGKRYPDDVKVTDLFYRWYELGKQGRSHEIQPAVTIAERYEEILRNLGIQIDLAVELTEISRVINGGEATADYAASRGEYLNAKIIAAALGYEFIDAATCIHFDERGSYLKEDKKLGAILDGRRAVIPGFYGSMPDGSIKTFSRGGSDITGAIVARAVRANLYENWTDVSGLLMADPRIVENPVKIETLTYRELRELTYMGATVFHDEAMFPVLERGIATNIRNTFDPLNSGTLIVVEENDSEHSCPIVGIAGRRNFTVITVEKMLMNQQVGFVRRILTILEANEISFEHMPSGIDTLSIIIEDKQLNGKLDKVVREIKTDCSPDTIEAYPNMAMIAVVGKAMAHTPGVAAKIFSALAEKGINIEMINQGSSEISIIVGVADSDYENAVRAIYNAFVK